MQVEIETQKVDITIDEFAFRLAYSPTSDMGRFLTLFLGYVFERTETAGYEDEEFILSAIEHAKVFDCDMERITKILEGWRNEKENM